MLVAFGWNNYCLKTISPGDLGINNSEWANARIQYRIKYFHICYIPVIPLGTYWAINIKNTQYQPSAELNELLARADKKNYLWIFSWSGIIFPLLIFMGYVVSEKVEHARWRAQSERSKEYLVSFFADKEKNRDILTKLDYINSLTDSLAHYKYSYGPGASIDYDDMPARKAEQIIDTSVFEIIKLRAECFLTHHDSLPGYSSDNTIIFSKIDKRAVWHDSYFPKEVTYNALQSGTWSGDGDSSDVMRSIRYFDDKEFALFIVEEKRFHPRMKRYDNEFIGGYSLCTVYLYDMKNQRCIRQCKFLGYNSEKVTTHSENYHDFSQDELESDLTGNLLKEVEDFIFNRKKPEPAVEPTTDDPSSTSYRYYPVINHPL